jgi:hypothetical protein
LPVAALSATTTFPAGTYITPFDDDGTTCAPTPLGPPRPPPARAAGATRRSGAGPWRRLDDRRERPRRLQPGDVRRVDLIERNVSRAARVAIEVWPVARRHLLRRRRGGGP